MKNAKKILVIALILAFIISLSGISMAKPPWISERQEKLFDYSLEELNEKRENLIKEIADLKEDLAAMEESEEETYSEERADLESQIAELEEQLENLEEEGSEAEKDVLEDQLDILKDQLEELEEADEEANEEERERLEEEIELLEEQLEAVEESIEGREEEAREAAEEAIEAEKEALEKELESLQEQLEALLESGGDEGAIEELEAKIAALKEQLTAFNEGEGKTEEKGFLNRIRKLSRQGMTVQAMEQLEQYIEENPDSWEALKLRWKIQRKVAKQQREALKDEVEQVKELIKDGEIEEALSKIEELRETYGVTDELLAQKAEIMEETGELEEAVESLEEAVRFNPWNNALYQKLGNLYQKTERKGIKVFVQGTQPAFDQPPVIKEGRTLVPVRAITEALGATVEYNPDTKEITITRGDTTVILKLESNTALVGGEEVELDVPAKAINARTVIPLRFVGQALGAFVDYDGEADLITIIEEGDSEDEEEEVKEE